MTARIEALYLTPVKSLALLRVDRATLTPMGLAGDRAFFLVGADDRLLSQREEPRLVQIRPAYDLASGVLTLRFPDGTSVSGVPADEAHVSARIHRRTVDATVVGAEFGRALSEFAGQPVRLARARPGDAFDTMPLTICSRASLARLGEIAGASVDERRFRQNVWISGVAPHEEDTWIGGDVRIGGAVVRAVMPDSRCVMTTQNPDSGERDLDTLRFLASYRRTDENDVNFGVHTQVVTPGEVAIGDEVAALART